MMSRCAFGCEEIVGLGVRDVSLLMPQFPHMLQLSSTPKCSPESILLTAASAQGVGFIMSFTEGTRAFRYK